MGMMTRAVASGLLASGILLAASSAAAATLLGSDREACLANSTSAVLANIHGLKDRVGRIRVEIYPDNEADFLKRDDDLIAEGKVFRRVWADIPRSGDVAMCIEVPRPGSYALVFIHQREGTKRFDFRVDGVGVPSEERIGRTMPKVGQARITVGPRVKTTDITVQYLRGLRGFAPLG